MFRVNEIFTSIDGEVNGFHQGRVSTFVRFQGCNLNCTYCDTEKAKLAGRGEQMTLNEVFNKIFAIGIKKVTITGGEPLVQKDLYSLITALVHHGFLVSIETNGSFPIIPMKGVSYVMDYKLPSSGESRAMDYENFNALGPRDFVKFVISDLDDYIQAVESMMTIKNTASKVNFAMSPVFHKDGSHNGAWLSGVMVSDNLDVILNLQIHKILEVK